LRDLNVDVIEHKGHGQGSPLGKTADCAAAPLFGEKKPFRDSGVAAQADRNDTASLDLRANPVPPMVALALVGAEFGVAGRFTASDALSRLSPHISRLSESNRQPAHYKCAALPIELRRRTGGAAHRP
jgi:hypothetical protein